MFPDNLELKRINSAYELANLENGSEVIVINKNPDKKDSQAGTVHGYLVMQRETCGIHINHAVGLQQPINIDLEDRLECDELITALRQFHKGEKESPGGAVYVRDDLFKAYYFEVYQVKQEVGWLKELGIRYP